MALILIFSLSLQAPFPPLGDPSRVARRGGGKKKKAASAQHAERGERRQECHQKTQGHVQQSWSWGARLVPREGAAAWPG